MKKIRDWYSKTVFYSIMFISFMIAVTFPQMLNAKILKSIEIKVFSKDRCKQSGLAHGLDDNCFGIKNYLISVNKKNLEQFLNDPEKYLAALSPLKKHKNINQNNYIMKFNRVQVAPGDHCVVSGQVLNEKDVVIEMVGGRRVPLKRAALKVFFKDPGKFFAKYQPKGALFSEEMTKNKPLPLEWIVLALYIFLGLIFGACSGQTAVKKGLSPKWFFAGLFLNVIGYFWILTKKTVKLSDTQGLRKIHTTKEPLICPECENENHPSAKICLECGKSLLSQSDSEVKKSGL